MGHSKLKVLFVCNEYPPSPHGGIGVIVRAIAERLVVSGISVVVLGIDPVVSHDTTENLNGVLVARLANKYRNDVKYRLGRYFLTAEPFLVRRYLSYRLEEAISIHKPDLIESYDWSGPLWRKPSVPLVVRMHGAHTAYNYYEGKRTSRLLKFFEIGRAHV